MNGSEFSKILRSFCLALVFAVPAMGGVTWVGVAGASLDRSITIAAAASMTDVIEALATAFSEAHGIGVTASFTASSAATRQVMNGAPFDLLISANTAWIAAARDAGAIDTESVRTIAGNRLVIVANSDAPLGDADTIVEILDAAEDGHWRIAIADPEHVPAGLYAAEALQALGRWDDLKAQLVPLQNVRAALAFVDRGDTPIGFAYATDIHVTNSSRVVARFDAALHSPIRYQAAVVSHAPSVDEAWLFVDFAKSPAGQAIIQRFGFSSHLSQAAKTGDAADNG